MPKLSVIFHYLGILEASSFLLLLFIAVPLKYLADNPLWVKIIGPIHGILFLAYIIAAVVMYLTYRWKISQLILAILCGLLPFGPFFLKLDSQPEKDLESTHQS